MRCFRRGYGDSYVAESFYDAESIRRRVGEGRLLSVVAVTPAGEIVGHMGLSLRRPGDTTVDAGNTLVDPGFRNQHLSARLGGALVARCREAGFLGFHHYPTTAHPVVQKLAVAGGGTETGVLFDYIPASTEYRELGKSVGAGPWAVIVVFQPVAPCPAREVFLPEPYRETLLQLYAEAGLARAPKSAAREPASGETRIDSCLEARRKLHRVHVERVGDDLERALDRAREAPDADLVHLDLSLADPHVGKAVEAARGHGFRFAALLPEYRDGDVLRLQYLSGRPRELPPPAVATEQAQRLIDFIARDRE